MFTIWSSLFLALYWIIFALVAFLLLYAQSLVLSCLLVFNFCLRYLQYLFTADPYVVEDLEPRDLRKLADAMLKLDYCDPPPPTRSRFVFWKRFIGHFAHRFLRAFPVIAPFILLDLVFGYCVLGVWAVNPNYGLDYLSAGVNTAASPLAIYNVFGDALAVAFRDALGTTPERNWAALMAQLDNHQQGGAIPRSVMVKVFCLCQFSANPAVWDRIITRVIALNIGHGTALAVDAAFFNDVRRFMTLCDWRRGAPAPGRVAPQRLLMYNPTLAAMTWAVIMPDAEVNCSGIMSQRWFCALNIVPALRDEAWVLQRARVANIPGLQWNQPFADTIASSSFPFPAVNNNVGGGFLALAAAGAAGAGTPFDRQTLANWLVGYNPLVTPQNALL